MPEGSHDHAVGASTELLQCGLPSKEARRMNDRELFIGDLADTLAGAGTATIVAEDPTTMAVGEEGDEPTTELTGEEGDDEPTTMLTGEEGDDGPTTMATGEEGDDQ